MNDEEEGIIPEEEFDEKLNFFQTQPKIYLDNFLDDRVPPEDMKMNR